MFQKERYKNVPTGPFGKGLHRTPKGRPGDNYDGPAYFSMTDHGYDGVFLQQNAHLELCITTQPNRSRTRIQ